MSSKLYRLSAVAAAAVLMALPTTARAGYTTNVLAAGVQSSSAPGAIVETFDSLATGVFGGPLVSAVGTYTVSPNAYAIVAEDAFGGANETQYIAVGNQSGNSNVSLTLTLDSPQAYFGFFWGALDSQNRLDVLSGGNVVLSLTSADFAGLSGDYFGNPNNGEDPSEAFFFLEILADSGSTFDQIVFFNGSGTGFETDNHTLVPEPSSLLALGIGGVGLLAAARRRRAKAAA